MDDWTEEQARGMMVVLAAYAFAHLAALGFIIWVLVRYCLPPFVRWLYKDIPPLTPMARRARDQTRAAFPVVQSPEQQADEAFPAAEQQGPRDMSYPR